MNLLPQTQTTNNLNKLNSQTNRFTLFKISSVFSEIMQLCLMIQNQQIEVLSLRLKIVVIKISICPHIQIESGSTYFFQAVLVYQHQ